MNKLKLYCWCFIVVAALFGGSLVIFKKEIKKLIITDIDKIVFNDTINRVYYFKDDIGPGTATELKNHDTSYGFNGFKRDSLRAMYLDFALPGDVLIKQPSSDTFILKRGDSTFTFDLFTSPRR